MDKTEFQKAAYELASLGLKVYPLCTKSKRPIEKGGFHNATNDINKVVECWAKYPYANIAISTGNNGASSSGIVVIDLDIDNEKGIDGKKSLMEWEQAQGIKINRNTWVAKTGRGGYHFYYKTEKSIKSSTSKVLNGVDIIADLKGIIAPPSVHPNGNRYKWIKGHAPRNINIAELGPTELKLIENYKPNTYSEHTTKSFYDFEVDNDGTIVSGCRNDTIFRKTCKLQSRGISDSIIRLEVSRYNQLHCSPPLDSVELNNIISGVLSRYPKGGGKYWRT